MRGKQLKLLADVADLARLDFEAAAISLVNKNGRLVSRYQGAYSSGQRWLDLEDAPKVSMAVSAMQFKSLAGLFSDEEDIEVTVTEGKGLRLKSIVKDIFLSQKGEPEEIEAYEPADAYVEIPIQTILREAECASEFSARSMAKPILTGLRIVSGGARLGIQSSDGISTLFESFLDVAGEYKFEMITPGFDLVLGLRLLEPGTVKLLRTPSQVMLYGANAMFRSSLLTGSWPDFSRVRQPRVRQSVKLPTSLVRSLVQSVRILGTSNDLRLRGDGEFLYLETVDAEAGHFEAKIPAAINGTYTYDVGSFLLAQELGPELIVQLPEEKGVPTLIESGTRRYWVSARI